MIPEGMEATPLYFASKAGLVSVFQKLLAFGVDVNTNCFYGTALQAASAEGHLDIVEELLKHGADLNASSEELGTALQAACTGGRASVVGTLVEKDADVTEIGGLVARLWKRPLIEARLESWFYCCDQDPMLICSPAATGRP